MAPAQGGEMGVDDRTEVLTSESDEKGREAPMGRDGGDMDDARATSDRIEAPGPVGPEGRALDAEPEGGPRPCLDAGSTAGLAQESHSLTRSAL